MEICIRCLYTVNGSYVNFGIFKMINLAADESLSSMYDRARVVHSVVATIHKISISIGFFYSCVKRPLLDLLPPWIGCRDMLIHIIPNVRTEIPCTEQSALSRITWPSDQRNLRCIPEMRYYSTPADTPAECSYELLIEIWLCFLQSST